jgi:hypothetical protein
MNPSPPARDAPQGRFFKVNSADDGIAGLTTLLTQKLTA